MACVHKASTHRLDALRRLSIANLSNLEAMLENGQVGSTAATIVSAINAGAFLTGSSSALAGANAWITVNSVVVMVVTLVLNEWFAEDPRPRRLCLRHKTRRTHRVFKAKVLPCAKLTKVHRQNHPNG